MTDAPAPLPETHEAWAHAVLQRQSAMLEQLGEAALRMALAIERRLSESTAEAPVDPAEAAMAFTRVARAVRLTALLQSKLVQELAPFSAAVARAAQKAQDRLEPGYQHKARVEGIVGRVARARHDDEELLDRLARDTAERLDDEDFYGDVLNRPVGELVALICRDLGLAPDWTRLAQEAWARAEAESGDPRSPFVGIPIPLPLDGVREIACDLDGQVRIGGDGPAAVRPTGHPHPQPFPHQGGREMEAIPPPGDWIGV